MTSTRKVAPTDLTELLDTLKHEILVAMNCHGVATIEAFDSERLIVKASMNYAKRIDGVDVPYPPMVDCPLVVLAGGPCRITFPIEKGDQCLIIFNDRDLDAWWASGNKRSLNSGRLHSFSDAIALVGLSSLKDKATNLTRFGAYDSTRVKMANGKTMVGVSPTQVKIASDSTSLGAELNTLLTALQTFSTAAGAATTAAQIAAAAAALAAPLAAVKLALTTPAVGLLE